MTRSFQHPWLGMADQPYSDISHLPKVYKLINSVAPSQSGLSIIGNIQQEGIQISFDGANRLLGFGPNVC
ncbi:unnamed protein product [Rhodiola kirilowii]